MDDRLYTKRTAMCDLFEKYRSDKSIWHNYTTLYDFLFRSLDLVDKPINLFELGLGTNNVHLPSNMGANGNPGASMYAFSEYFPNANIYGADIDMSILFQKDRIKTFFCNQTSPQTIANMWAKIDVEFDILIEDGLHKAFANIIFLDNSFHKVKKGGIYIIEDILNEDIQAIVDHLQTPAYDNVAFKAVVTLPMEMEWTRGTGRVNRVDNTLAILVR